MIMDERETQTSKKPVVNQRRQREREREREKRERERERKEREGGSQGEQEF